MEILDSHFHLYSMKKRGIDTTLPENLIGIDVGTDPYDYEERKALISPGIDYSHAAGPWCTSREDYTDAEDFGSRIRDCIKAGHEATAPPERGCREATEGAHVHKTYFQCMNTWV